MPGTSVQLSSKPQISERRDNTICAVVERSDTVVVMTLSIIQIGKHSNTPSPISYYY